MDWGFFILSCELTRLPRSTSLPLATSHRVSYGRIKAASRSVQPEGSALVLDLDYDQRAEVIQANEETHTCNTGAG